MDVERHTLINLLVGYFNNHRLSRFAMMSTIEEDFDEFEFLA